MLILWSSKLAADNLLPELDSSPVQERNLARLLNEILAAAIAIAGADFGNIQLLDPATGAALDIQLRAGVRAVQSTPLVSRSGTPLGMLSTHCRSPTRPDQRALRLLNLLARQAADMIDRERAEQARKRAETSLTEQKRLEALLADAISEEQTRLAQEIHDGLGQELISASIKTARSIAHGLSPMYGPARTVISALRELASLYANLSPPVPTITVSGENEVLRGLAFEVQSQLYRIAQEAIQNALKHAAASRVDVSLARADHRLVLTIADDGRSMSASEPAVGRGLSIMQHRAGVIAATLTVTSRPVRGTIVTCAVPMPSCSAVSG